MTVALVSRCGGPGRVTQGTGHSVDRYPAGLTHTATQLTTVTGEIWREKISQGLAHDFQLGSRTRVRLRNQNPFRQKESKIYSTYLIHPPSHEFQVIVGSSDKATKREG